MRTSRKLIVGASCLALTATSAALGLAFDEAPIVDLENVELAGRVSQLEGRLGERDLELRRSLRRIGDLERQLAENGIRTRPSRGTRSRSATDGDDQPDAAPRPSVVDLRSSLVVAGTRTSTPLSVTSPRWVGGNTVASNPTLQLYRAGGVKGSSSFQVHTLSFDLVDQRYGAAEKALGLSAYQVAELRRVVSERDAAYRNARHARVEDDGSGAKVVDDIDDFALQRADEVFTASMQGTLDRTQHATWSKAEWAKRFAGTRPVAAPQNQNPIFYGGSSVQLGTIEAVRVLSDQK